MTRARRPHLWRKLTTTRWLEANAFALDEKTGGLHSVIERPGRARLAIEFFCPRKRDAEGLAEAFGGAVVSLAADWEKRLFDSHKMKPLRIGKRLVVRSQPDPSSRTPALIIPAGAAFGTGEHATTAMSLRILERITRKMPAGWQMLDAGTGSGILALAGHAFGAGKVFAIDNDPLAIKTANKNARENGIRGVDFRVADVTRALAGTFDVITANLFSELLITVLPRFKRVLGRDGHLILSGVMRTQEAAVQRALRANGFRVEIARRRGKWIALLTSPSYS